MHIAIHHCLIPSSTDWDISSHGLACGLVSTQNSFQSMDPTSYNNGTGMHLLQHGNGASSSKRARESPQSPANFYSIAKDIQTNLLAPLNWKTVGFDPTLVVAWRLQLRCGMPLFILQSPLMKDIFFIFSGHSTLWSVTQLKKLHAQLQEATQGQSNPRHFENTFGHSSRPWPTWSLML